MGTGSGLLHAACYVPFNSRYWFRRFHQESGGRKESSAVLYKCAREDLQGTPRHFAARNWLWHGISQDDVEWVLKRCTVC
jgi:hypothetical protein